MIRYSLACEEAHGFESWFPSSEAYDSQRKRGLIACPICGSQRVEKQIMAPSVARTDRARPDAPSPAPTPTPPVAPEAPPQPVALVSDKERELRAMLKAIREHVEKNSEHVGDRFPDEARKMHYGEIEHRSIYGEASPREARELLDEGVEIHPLPIMPSDRN